MFNGKFNRSGFTGGVDGVRSGADRAEAATGLSRAIANTRGVDRIAAQLLYGGGGPAIAPAPTGAEEYADDPIFNTLMSLNSHDPQIRQRLGMLAGARYTNTQECLKIIGEIRAADRVRLGERLEALKPEGRKAERAVREAEARVLEAKRTIALGEARKSAANGNLADARETRRLLSRWTSKGEIQAADRKILELERVVNAATREYAAAMQEHNGLLQPVADAHTKLEALKAEQESLTAELSGIAHFDKKLALYTAPGAPAAWSSLTERNAPGNAA